MSTQRKEIYRRRRFWAVAIAILLAYLLVRLLTGGGPASPPPPGAALPALPGSPYAYRPAQRRAFATRAALGESQVLFTMSPGGALATAARVAAFRPLINRAVRGTNIPPALLEGLVFVESAGRPQVIAGDSVADAAGLTQILAGTGQTMLRMKINLRRSRRLTAQIGAAQAAGDRRRVAKLEAQRARIDQRFDPAKELAATVRYLRIAEASLGGRADLAVFAYHAGIGNVQQLLALYDGGRPVPYAQLYFDASPATHAAVLQGLEQLTDQGSLYYWRVLGAERIMAMWRRNRAALRRWALEAQSFPSDALVLLGLAPGSGGGTSGSGTSGSGGSGGGTSGSGGSGGGPSGPGASGRVPVFGDPGAVARAYWTKPAPELVPLPRNRAALHLRYAPSMGDRGAKLGAPAAIYRGLRPVALRMLIQIAAWVDRLAGTSAPLTVASTVIDPKYGALLGLGDDPPAATGYSFQIQRSYATEAQREAFQFVLDRLQDLNLIAWIRHATTIEITVAPGAGRVLAHGV